MSRLSKPPTVLLLFALLALLWASQCGATLVNITVDDTDTTAWTWVGSWHAITQDDPCTECNLQPDGNRAHNHSWHDGDLLSASFTFQGVAVYIYGIGFTRPPANITFAMSNPPISAFYYVDSSGVFVYDELFFSADGLDGTTQHTVVWNEEPNSINGGGIGLFDYAVVTVDQAESSSSSSPHPLSSTTSTSADRSTSSSLPSASATSSTSGGSTSSSPPSANNSGNFTRKSKAGPIAGGVVAAVAALVILAGVFYCLKRRNRLTSSSPMETTSRSPVYHPGYIVEPLQGSPISFPPSVSTIPLSVVSSSTPKEPTWIPSSTTPPAAQALDAEVERRLRNLEALVAHQEPPAYA
ncbi:hypothetical protein C8F01DRAFT_155804 [Mycena amicta]|nr:hypothetical protein C8F01DRAFT_155804 [Mycena amicta]